MHAFKPPFFRETIQLKNCSSKQTLQSSIYILTSSIIIINYFLRSFFLDVSVDRVLGHQVVLINKMLMMCSRSHCVMLLFVVVIMIWDLVGEDMVTRRKKKSERASSSSSTRRTRRKAAYGIRIKMNEIFIRSIKEYINTIVVTGIDHHIQHFFRRSNQN